jgi:hypothetical protein
VARTLRPTLRVLEALVLTGFIGGYLGVVVVSLWIIGALTGGAGDDDEAP